MRQEYFSHRKAMIQDKYKIEGKTYYSKSEIARAYGVSDYTANHWVKKKKTKDGDFINHTVHIKNSTVVK